MEKLQGDQPLKQEEIEEICTPFEFLELKKTPSVGLNIHGEDVQTHRKSHIMNDLKLPQIELVQQCEEQIRLVKEVLGILDELLELNSKPCFLKEYQDMFQANLKILQTRQTQLFMAMFIEENQSTPEFEQNYQSFFKSLEKYKVPLDHISDPMNLRILKDVHARQKEYLQDYNKTLKEIIKIIKSKKPDEKELYKSIRNAKITISKVCTVADIYSYACILPLDDLFSLDKQTHPRWKVLKNITTLRVLGSKEIIHQAFNEPRQGLNFASAMLSKIDEINKKCDFDKPNTNTFIEVVKGGFNIALYGLMKDKARKRAEAAIANPNANSAISLWNLPETGFVRNIVQMMLPNITQSEVLYIPRHFSQISQDLACQWCMKKQYDIADKTLDFSVKIDDLEKYTKQLPGPADDRILMRINSPYIIERVAKIEQTFGQKCRSLFKKSRDKFDAIIFHIHGGGFVSQSSFVHQMYIRRWANSLEVPIFSLDYRKAPAFPYPRGLDDCFQVYMWLLTYLYQVFNIKPSKIIITGDSAGGNLTAALTSLLIKLRLRVPDGIVLCYPALNLNYDNYTPSLLTCLDEPILPHTFLKICLQSYIQNSAFKPELDPFLSPIHSPDSILKQYPPCRIFVGNADPFHDDCCRLAEKLGELKKDVRLTVYDNFPHGFLQFDNPPKGMKYCRTAIDQVEESLGELIREKK